MISKLPKVPNSLELNLSWSVLRYNSFVRIKIFNSDCALQRAGRSVLQSSDKNIRSRFPNTVNDTPALDSNGRLQSD